MASTNKTSNYELSQFLGTDKPAWLSDYNSDMGKIDAQMKLNADAASAAQGDASSAGTAIGTLANLTTDAKTSVVAAINEVDGHADSAQSTASSALSASSTNATAITDLQNYLDLSVNNSYTGSQFTVTSGSGTIQSLDTLYIARNTGGSLCKIYGAIGVTGSTANSRTKIKLNVDTGLRPTSKIDLVGTGILSSTTTSNSIANLNLTINTDGTIELEGYHDSTSFFFRNFACLIFVKNFGDTPQA